MYRLTATYEIEPQCLFRLKRAENAQLAYTAKISRFSVEVTLVQNGGASFKEAHEQYEVRAVNKIRIVVSGQEDSIPPDVPRNDKGGRDWTARSAWFSQRTNEYHQAALTVANRVMKFFKYQMHAHLVREFTKLDIELGVTKWTGEDGQDLAPPGVKPIVLHAIGQASLGERDFTDDEDSVLQRALETELPIESYQEFMSDAQTSILRGNMPRAVMEMAIACEIAVRQAFFAKATPAGAAFEYIEDKARISVKVIDLVDAAARQAFGESFKDAAPDAYQDIDFLFRCRNKVAHRGETFYRDDRGTTHKVTRDTLRQWWLSAMRLLQWLAGHRSWVSLTRNHHWQ
jgi:hypothetical protein